MFLINWRMFVFFVFNLYYGDSGIPEIGPLPTSADPTGPEIFGMSILGAFGVLIFIPVSLLPPKMESTILPPLGAGRVTIDGATGLGAGSKSPGPCGVNSPRVGPFTSTGGGGGGGGGVTSGGRVGGGVTSGGRVGGGGGGGATSGGGA